MKPKFAINTESLLIMRTLYLNDIKFIKKSERSCNDDNMKFICDYLVHLEQQIESINEELLERGIIK